MTRRTLEERLCAFNFSRYLEKYNKRKKGGLEGWLQVELIDTIDRNFYSFERENPYPLSQSKCDFHIKETIEDNTYIELKCMNYGEDEFNCAKRFGLDIIKVEDILRNLNERGMQKNKMDIYCVFILNGQERELYHYLESYFKAYSSEVGPGQSRNINPLQLYWNELMSRIVSVRIPNTMLHMFIYERHLH